MSPIKKFGYADTDIFLLSGTPYTGYYNIYDNNAYVGKYTQDIPLVNENNILNSITRSNLFFNRVPTQNYSLTYTLSDFIFQPNEFINSNSIDNKLKKAYRNFIDTYIACFMPTSDFPYNMTYIGKLSSTNVGNTFVWVTSSLNTPIIPLSALSSFITRNSKIAYCNSFYNTKDTLIIANSGNIVVYSIKPGTTFNNVFSSFFIETNTASYGSLQFNNITSISKYDKNLYVCDSGNKAVYAYDISGVVDGDRALGYKFNLKDSVNTTQGNFIKPVLVGSSSNTVYVYDELSYTVFFYDTNFNLKNSYKNEKLFSVSQPVNLAYYRVYNQLFLLTSDFKIVIFDNEANANIVSLPTKFISENEVCRKIIFSNSNSDVFYLLTNKNLYKKFVSNLLENIGDYTFNATVTGTNAVTYGSVLYDIDILENNENFDNIILYGYDQLLNYNEKLIYYSILK